MFTTTSVKLGVMWDGMDLIEKKKTLLIRKLGEKKFT